MQAWRHHLHAHPETAFEETATAAFVADKLREFGVSVTEVLNAVTVVQSYTQEKAEATRFSAAS